MAGRTKSNRKTPMMTKDQFNTAIAINQIRKRRPKGIPAKPKRALLDELTDQLNDVRRGRGAGPQ